MVVPSFDNAKVVIRCETPKSPPGDYNDFSNIFKVDSENAMCETPKSPPGDYNAMRRLQAKGGLTLYECETPKSPPGDYNSRPGPAFAPGASENRCETPKSPPGDYNRVARRILAHRNDDRVKHLNPRQGITTVR